MTLYSTYRVVLSISVTVAGKFSHGESIHVSYTTVHRRHTDVRRTGATGYIGGEVLHQIATSKLHVEISCLNRDSAKASILKQAYPDIRIVEGDLDSADTLENEARNADVVFRTSTRILLLGFH